MAEKRRGRGGRIAALVVVVAAALLAVRLLGPGGSPAERPEGPSPAPPPAAAPDPAAAPEPSPPPGPALGGRVLDAAGRPVEGARVEALFETGEVGQPIITEAGPTGADGTFVLPEAPREWKGVLLRAVRGPLSVIVDMGDVPGGAADGMTIDMRLPATFSVEGLVLSAEEGRPLEDMELRVGDRTARSDERGRFRIEGVPAGGPLPDLEAKGAGRKLLRMKLPVDRPLDDLLLRVERE